MKESKRSNIVLGIVFLALGIIFFGNNIKLWDIKLFFDGWWTLFIIIPSFIGLFKKSEFLSSLFSMLVGVMLLLACQDIISFSIIGKIIFPLIFIFIGIALITKPHFSKKVELNKVDGEDIVAFFSGREEKITSKDYKGSNCVSIFGGIDLDLRKIDVKNDIVIEVVTVFGGVDIILPEKVNVVTSGIPIFGGVENKYDSNNDGKYTVYINYVSVFGGVEVK